MVFLTRMSAFGIAIKAIAWTTPVVSKEMFGQIHCTGSTIFGNVFSPLCVFAGPRNNMQPDTVNFETLASVYGVVGGPAPGAPSSSATEPVNPQTPPQRERDNEEDDDEDDRRLRRRVVSEQRVGVAQNDFPPSVQQRMKEVDSVVHGGGSAGRRWRLLHESPHGRALEMDLGEGYTVQLHFLLA